MMRRRLKLARLKAGLTQAQVAECVGLVEYTYKQIEQGRGNGSKRVWEGLSELFQTPIEALKEIGEGNEVHMKVRRRINNV